MAHFPMHSYGIKKHNCCYGQLTDMVTPGDHNPPPKNKRLPRPKTRRHPEDSPHRLADKFSRASGNISSSSNYLSTGYSNVTNKSKTSDGVSKNNCHFSYNLVIPGSSARTSYPSTDRNMPMDKVTSQGKSQQPHSVAHYETNETSNCTTPKKVTPAKYADTSLEEHEYLQFLLRITEDIIRNDLYSNKEMKKVFTSHVKANSHRLELDRMLLRIHELMKELNIPLTTDGDENSSASWTDIAATMRGLLCLEKMKLQEEQTDDKTKSAEKKNCICFDLRPTYPTTNTKCNEPEEEIENFNYQNCTPTTKFETSLDRLTEHTEPLSSRPTCKISSSFSNFGDVDVLPGFECLETPKVSSVLTCVKYEKKKALNTHFKSFCHCQVVVKKKPMVRKRKFTRRRRRIRFKKIGKDEKDQKKLMKSENHETQVEIENRESGKSMSKYNNTPIIITIQEDKKEDRIIQTNSNDLYPKKSNNEYIFINGPVYLLRRFVEENPHILIRAETPPCPIPEICSKSYNSKSGNEDSSSQSEVADIDEEKEQVTSEDGKVESQHSVNVEVLLSKLTKLEKCMNSSEEEDFHYFELNDGCGQNGLPDGEKTNRLCDKLCPYKSICSKLRLASSALEASCWNDEYDLTPHKDEEIQNTSDFVPVISPSMIRDFLTTREIQTDDLPHIPLIVGAVLISQDGPSDTDNPDPKTPVTNDESQIARMRSEPITQPTTDYFEFEKGMTEPTNYNILLMATSHSGNPGSSQSRSGEKRLRQSQEGKGPEVEIPGVSSYQTNDTLPTLGSTATVERTKQYLEIEEGMYRKSVAPMFAVMADENENRHLRRVSILKNPIVQVPMEKIFSDNDDSKKKQESIIRTVEGLKERQISRDPYLDKVLQEIESSRETRAPDRILSTEVSEKSEHLAMPGPSALKHTGRTSYYPRDENTNGNSTEDLTSKMISSKQKDGEAGGALNSGINSEVPSEHFLTPLDEQLEFTPKPSQLIQMDEISAGSEFFRSSKEKNEAEISATLDKLVETLKNQQENDEELQEKNDEFEEKKKPDTSSRRHPIICCGLCKKKKASSALPYNEPLQMNTFSEQDYKAKSEAFELALASLGQKQKTPENEEPTERVVLREDDGVKPSEYTGPSPIVHSGNRLSLVRITDERETDLETLNADFEEISTKISNDRIK
ncbi:uncharacterized protein LOC123671110 isoform X2 [Harmonia axyridis]|nr:uncharacterized protein LOC123671110 isoform X2 [Harmonia axyridis]